MSKRCTAILLCILVFPLTALAEASPEFGRLLTTPEERALLETLRHRRTAEGAPEGEVAQGGAADEARVYTLKGLVRRPDGHHVVWLNRGNTLDGSSTVDGAGVELKKAGRKGVPIRLPGDAGRVVLKPGQSYDLATGERYDVFEAAAPEKAVSEASSVAEGEENPSSGEPGGDGPGAGKKK